MTVSLMPSENPSHFVEFDTSRMIKNCFATKRRGCSPRPCRGAVQTGRDRMELHETRYSSRLSSRHGALRLRPHVSDSLNRQGRHAARGNLLELPSLLHGQAEVG